MLCCGSNNDRRSSSSCLCRMINYIITVILLGGIVGVLWYMMGSPDADEILDNLPDLPEGYFGDALENFTNFVDGWDNDPFAGMAGAAGLEPGEANNATVAEWKVNQKNKEGLSLTLWNALDSTWVDIFDAVVIEWDEGTPDALDLTTKRVSVDTSCSPVDDVMKVCNNNFGATGWLGINEMVTTVPENIILSSVAKMNEYYLLNADDIERQYTMCHEMGHGFGLAHTDENFYNFDLGNCLDYTDNPKNNLHPGTVNYQTLANVYGIIPGSSTTPPADTTTTSEALIVKMNTTNTSIAENQANHTIVLDDGWGGERRNLRRTFSQSSTSSLSSSPSSSSSSLLMENDKIRSEYERALQELQDLHHPLLEEKGASSTTRSFSSRLLKSSWNLLEWNARGSSYERYFGETTLGGEGEGGGQALRLEVHMLHPRDWKDDETR